MQIAHSRRPRQAIRFIGENINGNQLAQRVKLSRRVIAHLFGPNGRQANARAAKL